MRRRPCGLTVIECILAAFIVLSGFLAVAAVFPASYHQATLNQNHILAVGAAKNVIEAINSSYQNPVSPNLSQPIVINSVTEGQPVVVTFTVKSIVFASGRSPNAAATALSDVVTVTLEWTERDASGSPNNTKTLSFSGGVGSVP